MRKTVLKKIVIGLLLLHSGGTVLASTACRFVHGIDKQVCVVRGRITDDVTWNAQSYWILRGAVFIEAPARLTIDPGTEIFGEFATIGTLVIARGAQIFANGTARNPVVFSSDQPIGQRRPGDWGGIIINGNAPVNVPGGESIGEGDTGPYGGDNPNDDSGHLRYVRIEFAGAEFSPDNELNGIAFQGVGSGTEVSHLMVKFSKDDGIEFFGGTVGVKYVVLQGIADDSLDWTDGWTGKGQFIIAMQSGEDADQGIEGDNNADNNDLIPRSHPVLYNLTLIGDPDHNEGDESDVGILLREGTSATIRNFIVLGFKEAAIDIDDSATFGQIMAKNLTLANGIIYGNCVVSGCVGQFLPDGDDNNFNLSILNYQPKIGFSPVFAIPPIPSITPPRDGFLSFITTRDFVAGSPSISFEDPLLVDPFNLSSPNYQPSTGFSPVFTVLPAIPPHDGFFDVAPFIGAVGPADSWWQGWTDFSTN